LTCNGPSKEKVVEERKIINKKVDKRILSDMNKGDILWCGTL
jgi:hypothetical protein